MEQTNGNGNFEYQLEVEVSSNSVDALGDCPKKSHHVKEQGKPPCNEKKDEDDDFLDETDEYDLNEEEIDDEIDDEEIDGEEEDEESIEESFIKSEFSSGAFVALKTDLCKSGGEPTIWRIDGKLLVRKYEPFKRDGKILYRNTPAYSGWNKDSEKYYYPVTVATLSETQSEHIVEFRKDLIPKEEINERCNEDEAEYSEGQIDDDRESLDGEIDLDEDENESQMEENSGKNENFSSGSFLVVKLEAVEKRPPAIWKIECTNLLQKFVPREGNNGQMLYESTNMFNGWSNKIRNRYYPVVVVSLEESPKKHVVELKNVIRAK